MRKIRRVRARIRIEKVMKRAGLTRVDGSECRDSTNIVVKRQRSKKIPEMWL